MAQAARLNLRMQKELKLLLTDPPHGAKFPLLCNDSTAASSLSTIDAQIEGPQGSVYDKGIFKIKIQIPERYPFQPPSVTFATPIYHPNIDNSGRICLDILNLPPKGAWQPSLNISTVLTSIGLLLSEPNPDDGLMCEASREYKYNRQVFDQKARAMTEKYAKAGVGVPNCGTPSMQSNSSSSTVIGIEGSDKVANHEVQGFSSYKITHRISQKLSLESSGLTHEMNGGDITDHLGFANQMEAKGERKELRGMPEECNLRHEILNGTRRKLSLASSTQCHKRDGHDMEDVESNGPQTISMAYLGPPKALHKLQSVDNDEQHACKDTVVKKENGSSNAKFNKLCLVGKKLSPGPKGSLQIQEKEDKENVVPIHNLPFSNPQTPGKTAIGQKLSLDPLTLLRGRNDDDSQLPLPSQNLSAQELNKHEQSNSDYNSKISEGFVRCQKESPVTEPVIVLDSEDSEEECNGSMRSKLPLVRNRTAKRKAQA